MYQCTKRVSINFGKLYDSLGLSRTTVFSVRRKRLKEANGSRASESNQDKLP